MKYSLITAALLHALAFVALLVILDKPKTTQTDGVTEVTKIPATRSQIALDASRSVGLVLLQFEDDNGSIVEIPAATAWVAEGGFLATNAHVAELFADYPQAQIAVRFPGPDPITVRVEAAYAHPAYGRLGSLLQEKDSALIREGWIPAADVGLFEVQEEDRALLPPALPFASEEELSQTLPLDSLIIIGHPLENLVANGSAPQSPTPAALFGTLTRVTDHLFRAVAPGEGRLLHFDVPITGGVSGSPILNAEGRVIGLASAGNLAFIDGIGRLPLPVGNHFGQRLDWLFELLEDPTFGPCGWIQIWSQRVAND